MSKREANTINMDMDLTVLAWEDQAVQEEDSMVDRPQVDFPEDLIQTIYFLSFLEVGFLEVLLAALAVAQTHSVP